MRNFVEDKASDAVERTALRTIVNAFGKVLLSTFSAPTSISLSDLSEKIAREARLPKAVSVASFGSLQRGFKEELRRQGFTLRRSELVEASIPIEGTVHILLQLSEVRKFSEQCFCITEPTKPEYYESTTSADDFDNFVFSVERRKDTENKTIDSSPLILTQEERNCSDMIETFGNRDQIQWLRNHVTAPDGQFQQLITTLDNFADPIAEKGLSKKQTENYRQWRQSVVDKFKTDIEAAIEALKQGLSDRHELGIHVKSLKNRLDDVALEELLGENQGDLVLLYRSIHDAFDRHDLIAPNRLAAVPNDVHRINQIETIIDLYNLKIDRTQNDETLSDEVRERKVQALQHLMEKDIDALGGVV